MVSIENWTIFIRIIICHSGPRLRVSEAFRAGSRLKKLQKSDSHYPERLINCQGKSVIFHRHFPSVKKEKFRRE